MAPAPKPPVKVPPPAPPPSGDDSKVVDFGSKNPWYIASVFEEDDDDGKWSI